MLHILQSRHRTAERLGNLAQANRVHEQIEYVRYQAWGENVFDLGCADCGVRHVISTPDVSYLIRRTADAAPGVL
jgi:hypothetical protein